MSFKHFFNYVLLICLTILPVYISTPSVFAENLIQNGGFEDGTNNWYTFGATVTQSNNYKKTNSFSGQMQTTSTNSGTKYIYTVVSVTGGKNYRASAFVIKQGEANANILLKVAFYQSTDGTGSQIDGISYSSPKINQNTLEFQFLETDTLLAPAAATSARIRPSIEMPTGATQNGIAYLDDIKFEEIAPSTPAPSFIPSPSPTSAPSSSPTPKPTPSFIISDIPVQINSNQSFNVSIDLVSPNNKNTDYYLSGAFKKTNGTRYFGLTKVNSNWVKYSSSNYLNQHKITTDDNGIWTGTLEVKPDTEDSDYKGPGDYIFKVARYLSSSSPTWSNNESSIKIVAESNQTGTAAASTPPTPNSSALIPSAKITATFPYTASVAAAATTSAAASAKTATPEADIKVKNQKQTNPIVWIGAILIFAGVSSIGYIYLKSNGKIPFKF